MGIQAWVFLVGFVVSMIGMVRFGIRRGVFASWYQEWRTWSLPRRVLVLSAALLFALVMTFGLK